MLWGLVATWGAGYRCGGRMGRGGGIVNSQAPDGVARGRREPARPQRLSVERDKAGGGAAAPPRVRASKLGDIRRAAGLTQVKLAANMGSEQASISRLEKNKDMLLSTLVHYLNGLGAERARIVVSINGVEVELPLDRYRPRAPRGVSASPRSPRPE